MSKGNVDYDQFSYGGLVNRIRDGIPLTDHQKKTMELCGLTVKDFKNQKSTEEKCAIVNAHRLQKSLGIVDPQLCPDKENGSESEAPSR